MSGFVNAKSISMKNVLIPTDFTIKSLNQVKHAVALLPENYLNITLFHVLQTSDSIGDLLLFSKRRLRYYDQISDDFNEACEILKNKYRTQISRLHTTFLFGSSAAVFSNFLEGNHIDLVFLPVDYTFRQFTRESIDPVKMIRRSSCKIVEVELGRKAKKEEMAPAVLSDLLAEFSS